MTAGTVTTFGPLGSGGFSWTTAKGISSEANNHSRLERNASLIGGIVAFCRPRDREGRSRGNVLYTNQSRSPISRAAGGALPQAEIGIIGGSGLYSMPGLTKVKEVRLKTPFGAPSDAYVCGMLEGRKVAFLARHGRGHVLLPSELNFRADIHGFKQLGVERIVSVSAVGSLKEEHKPLEFVIPDQFFDRTRHRVDTFF